MSYEKIAHILSVLGITESSSALHGRLCAYVAMKQEKMAESYLLACIPHKKNDAIRQAAGILFEWFVLIQEELDNDALSFDLLLPAEDYPLGFRAEAFSQWCGGYLYVLNHLGITSQSFFDTETQAAFTCLAEFSELDYEAIDVSEDDELSFSEVCEYTRMTVFHMYHDVRFELVQTKENLH